MITVEKLSKSYMLPDGEKLEIFRDMDMSIKSWEFVVCMGPSGQGKTTFLNILAGLVSDYSGSVEILGKKLETMSEAEKTAFRGKHIAYVFQEYNLIESLTVEENIELVCDINATQKRYSVDEILEKVWLLSKKYRYPFELSWGEKQRVALARSFISHTDIILADEPTWSLDEVNAKKVMALFHDLWKESGVTLIMITHSPEVASYGSCQYVLSDSRFKKI